MKQLWDWLVEHWFSITVTAAAGAVTVGLVLR